MLLTMIYHQTLIIILRSPQNNQIRFKVCLTYVVFAYLTADTTRKRNTRHCLPVTCLSWQSFIPNPASFWPLWSSRPINSALKVYVKGRGAGRDEENVKSTPPAAQTNTLVQARTCIGEAVRLEKQLWKHVTAELSYANTSRNRNYSGKSFECKLRPCLCLVFLTYQSLKFQK